MNEIFARIKLDKNSSVPLYYQLKKQVLGFIEDSTLAAGDPIPTENELCAILGVSRPTIRSAFGQLASEGYLIRYKSRGTFVANPKLEAGLFSKLGSFTQAMLQKGKHPHTSVLELSKYPARPEINEALQLSLEDPLLYLSRLLSVENEPSVYVETYLSFHRYERLLSVDFASVTLYQAIEELCGVQVIKLLREIEAVGATAREAKLLHVQTSSPLCLVKTLAYSDGSSLPVEFSAARYRGDRNKFSVEVYR